MIKVAFYIQIECIVRIFSQHIISKLHSFVIFVVIATQLSDFDAPTVNTYSLETTIAEKIDAILSLMEFSSRMKDYYDIYYLANKFDFDGATLTEALKKTFENRGHNFTVEQFEQVMGFDLSLIHI